MKKVTDRRLRPLTPGALADLLALGEALRVVWPDPALQQLAGHLVPPIERK